jgi:predicted MFS family arabinose efflux permease
MSANSPLTQSGWRVVIAAHLGVMFGFGSLIVYTFGIFLKPLAAEFGWSREEISRAFGIAAMSIAVASPLLGRALDRVGPKAVILPCFVVFGGAVLGLSQLNGALWQFYALFVLIGLAGNGTTQMGYSGAVSSWFDRKRGLALAVVLAGTGIGSIVHPVLAERIISIEGWRSAYLVFGAMALLMGIPLTAAWVRMKPSKEAQQQELSGMSTKDALRQREYWLLVGVLFLSSISVNGALTHLAAFLTDRGMSLSGAALATGLLGVSNLAGRMGTGWLLDRVPGPRLSLCLLLAMAAGMVVLSQATTLWAAGLAVVLIGAGLGGEADITPYLLTRYFGLKSFSTLYGFTWTFYAVAGGIGPVLFGRMFDTTGSYVAVLIAASCMTAIAGLLMLGMRPVPRIS